MVAQASTELEMTPDPLQGGRIIFELLQAIHRGKHAVTQDREGIHVQLEEPADLGELGSIPNRMADRHCAKIAVQDPANPRCQIIAYDSRGLAQFRFGHPEGLVAGLTGTPHLDFRCNYFCTRSKKN